MPRNASGVYSKPANTAAIPGETILSARYNSQVDDMVQDANAARPIVAGGTGATTAADALTNLGVTTIGSDIITALDAEDVRDVLELGDVTDDDDLSVDPDNIGTRGNTAAAIEELRTYAIAAFSSQPVSQDDGDVVVEVASAVTIPPGDYLAEMHVLMTLSGSGGTLGEKIFGQTELVMTDDSDDSILPQIDTNLRTLELIYFADSAGDLSVAREGKITKSFTVATETDVNFTVTFDVFAVTDSAQDIFCTTRYIKLTPIVLLS